jgi:hypothetical protein
MVEIEDSEPYFFSSKKGYTYSNQFLYFYYTKIGNIIQQVTSNKSSLLLRIQK